MKQTELYFEQLEQTYEQTLVSKSYLHFIVLSNITFQVYLFTQSQ